MVPPGRFITRGPDVDAPMRHLAARSRGKKIYGQLIRNCRISQPSRPNSCTERKDKSIRIEQTIFVERDSQRKIVLGKGGATIKVDRRGFAARRSARSWRCRAHLSGSFKVRGNGRRSRPLTGNGP